MTSATDKLRKSLDFMRIWISEDAHLGESAISRELEKAEGLRKLDAIEQAIAATIGSEVNGETSDGYHTFNELYHHRAVLFSVIVRDHRDIAWKARKHHDGTMYDGMFIVGVETPSGQATYHYDLDPYWDMFDCKECEYAPEWDGHTPDEAIARIAELGRGECEECARTAKKMLEIANEMRHIGASSMTPHQLFCCWAHDIERVVEQ